jgi:hypothetical protein
MLNNLNTKETKTFGCNFEVKLVNLYIFLNIIGLHLQISSFLFYIPAYI